MIRRITCIIIFNFLLLNLIAQDSKIQLGIGLSPYISSLRSNNFRILQDFKFGLSPGVNFDYYLSNKLVLKTGIEYYRKGVNSDFVGTDNDGQPLGVFKTKFNYDYISIPFSIAYFRHGISGFYIEGGLFAGYLLSHKIIVDALGTDFNGEQSDYSIYKKIDLGLVFGLGYKLKLSKKLFLDLGLIEQNGLINITKDNTSPIKTHILELKIRMMYLL